MKTRLEEHFIPPFKTMKRSGAKSTRLLRF
jgi:hypothetical protein